MKIIGLQNELKIIININLAEGNKTPLKRNFIKNTFSVMKIWI
jgi:hypothetical protein